MFSRTHNFSTNNSNYNCWQDISARAGNGLIIWTPPQSKYSGKEFKNNNHNNSPDNLKSICSYGIPQANKAWNPFCTPGLNTERFAISSSEAIKYTCAIGFVGIANISKENMYHKVEFVLVFLFPFCILWKDVAVICF